MMIKKYRSLLGFATLVFLSGLHASDQAFNEAVVQFDAQKYRPAAKSFMQFLTNQHAEFYRLYNDFINDNQNTHKQNALMRYYTDNVSNADKPKIVTTLKKLALIGMARDFYREAVNNALALKALDQRDALAALGMSLEDLQKKQQEQESVILYNEAKPMPSPVDSKIGLIGSDIPPVSSASSQPMMSSKPISTVPGKITVNPGPVGGGFVTMQ